MSDKPRPSIFIGSSVEGLAIAEAIQLNLDYSAEVTIWHQGVFGLSKGSLESLVAILPDFDFAVLVLTPDDVTHSRGIEQQSPRDNVLFELGLFLGSLGRDRTFIVYDRESPIRLPSDLAGVTPATFQQHSDGNLQAALGPVATLIKGSIGKHGQRDSKLSADITKETQFQIIHDLLDASLEQFIILMFEQDLSLKRDSDLWGPGVRFDYLLRSGAGGFGEFHTSKMCDLLPDAGLLQINLRGLVSLTDRGKEFANWLIDRGHRAAYFASALGHWGEKPPGWPDRFFPGGVPPFGNPPTSHSGNAELP